jgi:hypothetical protein
VPAWFAVQINGPGAGTNGDTASTYAAGTLHTKPEYELENAGVAFLDSPSAGEAIREALTGTIQMFVPPINEGYEEHIYPFNPNTVGFAASEHKPYLLQPLQPTGGGTGEGGDSGPPVSPPSNIWVLMLEDLSFSPYSDWDYNDRYWVVSAAPVTWPEVTLIAPPAPVITTVGDPDRYIELSDVFFDPSGVGTYTATSWNTGVVQATMDQHTVRLQFSPTQPGTTTVTLTGTDRYGHTVSTDFPVIVRPVTNIVVSGPPDGLVGVPYPLTINPNGEYVPQWLIDWGDGQTQTVPGGANAVQVNHVFAELGNKLIQVRGPGDPFGGVLGAALTAIRDPNESSSWTVNSRRETEGNAGVKTMTFTVTLKGNAPQEDVNVKYRTVDGSATSAGANADYVDKSGELTIQAGQNTATVDITINGEQTDTKDEEFFLVLEVPAWVNGQWKQDVLYPFGRGFIENDDALPAAANDLWTKWSQQPPGTNTVPDFPLGDWRKAVENGVTSVTTPQGPPWTLGSLTGEGPYMKYTGGSNPNTIGSFKFTFDYRTLDQSRVKTFPRGVRFKDDWEQHYSNSGVYIYDRYEVQIVDPHKYTENQGVKNGVIQDVKNGDVVVESKNQLTPGALYAGLTTPTPPALTYQQNVANATGQWNTMVIEFDPGTIDSNDNQKLSVPAWIKVTLNGTVVYKGEIKMGTTNLTGTGSRSNVGPYPIKTSGAIFLQSHWGSQVEFRNPVVDVVAVTRS